MINPTRLDRVFAKILLPEMDLRVEQGFQISPSAKPPNRFIFFRDVMLGIERDLDNSPWGLHINREATKLMRFRRMAKEMTGSRSLLRSVKRTGSRSLSLNKTAIWYRLADYSEYSHPLAISAFLQTSGW